MMRDEGSVVVEGREPRHTGTSYAARRAELPACSRGHGLIESQGAVRPDPRSERLRPMSALNHATYEEGSLSMIQARAAVAKFLLRALALSGPVTLSGAQRDYFRMMIGPDLPDELSASEVETRLTRVTLPIATVRRVPAVPRMNRSAPVTNPTHEEVAVR